MNVTYLVCETHGCYWSGTVDELVSRDDDPDNFSYCPECEGCEFHAREKM